MEGLKSNREKSWFGISVIVVLIIFFFLRKSKQESLRCRIDQLTEQVNMLKAKLDKLSRV